MRKLELRFKNMDEKIVTFQLDNPVTPIDSILVNAAMDEIIEQNAFTSSGGDLLTKESARIIEQKVEEVEIL